MPGQSGLLVDGNVLMLAEGMEGSVTCFGMNRAGSMSATVILCKYM